MKGIDENNIFFMAKKVHLEKRRKELIGDMIFDLIGMACGGAGIAYVINTGAPECGIFFLAAVIILLYRFWVDGKEYRKIVDVLHKERW